MKSNLVSYDDRYRGGVNWTQTMINHAQAADMGQNFSEATYVVDEANPFDQQYAEDSWAQSAGAAIGGAGRRVKSGARRAARRAGSMAGHARRTMGGYGQAAARHVDPRSAQMRRNFAQGRARGQNVMPGLGRQSGPGLFGEQVGGGGELFGYPMQSNAPNWSVGRGLDRGAYGAGYGVGAGQRMGQLGRSYGGNAYNQASRPVQAGFNAAANAGRSAVEFGRNDLPQYYNRATGWAGGVWDRMRGAPGQAYEQFNAGFRGG